jgi:glycine betaine catabolism A
MRRPSRTSQEKRVNYLTRQASSVADLAALVERRSVGYSLEAPFYNSQQAYDLDMDAVFGRHWLFCATEAEVAEPGDYVTAQIGKASIIVVRDDDGSVRAMHNVCRHRGSRILEAACGSVGNLVCPYHQWTYRTDGSLIYAESQPPGFDRERFGLKPVHVGTVGGLIFVCLADEPPTDLDEVAAEVEPYLKPYQLQTAKVAHQMELVEEGNWKLVMENNRECQHCDASHPELITAYFPFHRYSEEDVTPRMRPAFERYQAATEHLDNVCTIGRVPRETKRDLENRPTGYMVMRLPLDGDGASFGPDGAQVCQRLMGEVKDPRFGDLTLHVQPNAWFHMLSDHAVVFSVLPVAPDRTLVRTTWLVHADAVEGVDYDVESLTQVWRATNDQDRALVETAQRGTTDPSYEPGPYGLVEDDVEAFVNWYIQRLREYLFPHHEHAEQLAHLAPVSAK